MMYTGKDLVFYYLKKEFFTAPMYIYTHIYTYIYIYIYVYIYVYIYTYIYIYIYIHIYIYICIGKDLMFCYLKKEFFTAPIHILREVCGYMHMFGYEYMSVSMEYDYMVVFKYAYICMYV
jgi:hypothetical protein